MKKHLVTSLLLLSSGQAIAMEAEALSKPGPIMPVLEVSDLRCQLMTSLYAVDDAQSVSALNSFKAFSCIDAASYKFFRENKTATIDFLQNLLKVSYCKNNTKIDDFWPKIAPYINTKGMEAFEGRLMQSDWLCRMCSSCAKNNKWNPFLAILQEGLKPSFLSTIMQYYFSENSVHKTLLIKALEYKAPGAVIKPLIDLGSQVKDLPSRTCPPCLVVMKNYLNCRKELANTQDDTRRALLIKELEQLENTLDTLLANGACITEPFCPNILTEKPETPLSAAVKAEDLTAVQLAINKGAQSLDRYALLALSRVPEETFYSLAEALFTIPSTPEHFLYCLLTMRTPRMGMLFGYEEASRRLSWVLDRVDLNVPVPYEEDLSFLDIARICQQENQNNEVINLFIEKGALSKECNTPKIEHMREIMAQDPSSEESIEKFLNKIQAAIDEWGFNGVPLPVIDQALSLASSHSHNLKLAEFFKTIALNYEFRPFFLEYEYIASFDHLLFTLFEKLPRGWDTDCKQHERNILKLMNWFRQETTQHDTPAHEKESDEFWKELIKKALSVDLDPSATELRDILVSAKRAMLTYKPETFSCAAALYLLSFTQSSESLPDLYSQDFLKWAHLQGYLLESYSSELSTEVLHTLVSLCALYPEILQNHEHMLYKSLTWLADHTTQERTVFEEWKAIAQTALDQQMPELGFHIDAIAQLTIGKL